MIKKNSWRSAREVQGINVAAKWQILLLEIFAFLRKKSNICLAPVASDMSALLCVWCGREGVHITGSRFQTMSTLWVLLKPNNNYL